MLTNKRLQHCSDVVLLLNAGYVMKAKDKDHWQKLFSHFCSRAANEEEEIAHKLLGEQFRVSLSSGHICLNYEHVNVSTAPVSISWRFYSLRVKLLFSLCCWCHLFLLYPGTAGLVTQPFQSSTLWWQSQSGKRETLRPLKRMPVCNVLSAVWQFCKFPQLFTARLSRLN